MTSSDLPFADQVRECAGWNQTREDWRLFLEWEPAGCFVAEVDGVPAGTATTVCYGTDLAWIGMVLVHPAQRRHGAGRALLGHCIASLGERRIRSIKLDATPLGKTLYDQLGFLDEWTLTRWATKAAEGPPRSVEPMIRPLRDTDWPRIFALDDAAFGVPRHRVLRGLAQQRRRAYVHLDAAGEVDGFGLLRAGSRAWCAGPVLAADASVGVALLGALLAEVPGEAVVCTVPNQNSEVVEFVERAGFTRQRPLIRMFLGRNSTPGIPSHCRLIADPAIG
ncbi:MAG: GNAT family N-acetyltransferase [Opitutaceae bacterium]|nr:GNAT family N-acetyltransferase [Opitutaceae bacterium]